MEDVFISLYLDKRRVKKNGVYPVKLRVFTKEPRQQKLYATEFELTPSEFKECRKEKKNRKRIYKDIASKMDALLGNAENEAANLNVFNFDRFEKRMFRKAGEGQNIFYHYEQVIQDLKQNDRIKTASSYELSLKSLKLFMEYNTGRKPAKLNFRQVNPQWLNKYENYMLNVKERSRTTVGIYLRPLRAIFNTAIDQKDIEADIYPFGKKKYQIPAPKSVKKALTREQLGRLFNAPPQTPQQEEAKDFWFFSYTCNGMNIKDIANLRYKDVQGDQVTFYRAKTINTSKTDLKLVKVYLTDFAKQVMEKYGNPNQKPGQLIFSIVSDNDTELEKHRKINNFIRYVNQALKKLAKAEGLPETISSYWARHSFATNAIRSGASMEFVSEALSHSNLKTTQTYFAGFEEEKKKELMDNLMNFE